MLKFFSGDITAECNGVSPKEFFVITLAPCDNTTETVAVSLDLTAL